MKLTKFIPSFIASAALILLGIGVTPLANAAPWTIISSGTINDGYDYSGVFGSVGNLAGLSFTQSITLDPIAYEHVDAQSYYQTANSGSLSGTATDTVTVNGVTQTFILDLSQFNWGQTMLVNLLTQNIANSSHNDFVYQTQTGFTADGGVLSFRSQMFSYDNPFNLGLGYDQIWSHNALSGDYGTSVFSIYGGSDNAYFNSYNLVNLSINSPVAAVPEPETYAMLLAGLGLLGFAGRRRKKG